MPASRLAALASQPAAAPRRQGSFAMDAQPQPGARCVSSARARCSIPSTVWQRKALHRRGCVKAITTLLCFLLASSVSAPTVTASTLAQLANGEVVISSPEHVDSYMVRVDVAASKERPGICSGDQFCCQPAAADRAWYLIDGESAGSFARRVVPAPRAGSGVPECDLCIPVSGRW